MSKNGRVINVNSVSTLNVSGFGTYTKNIKSGHSTLGNQIQTNTLSRLFFSNKNCDSIQNQIRYNVHKRSNGKYTIGRQRSRITYYNEINIFTISPNLEKMYTKQIKYLNDLVIEECVPKIISKQPKRWIYKDIQNLPVPIDRPVNTQIRMVIIAPLIHLLIIILINIIY